MKFKLSNENGVKILDRIFCQFAIADKNSKRVFYQHKIPRRAPSLDTTLIHLLNVKKSGFDDFIIYPKNAEVSGKHLHQPDPSKRRSVISYKFVVNDGWLGFIERLGHGSSNKYYAVAIKSSKQKEEVKIYRKRIEFSNEVKEKIKKYDWGIVKVTKLKLKNQKDQIKMYGALKLKKAEKKHQIEFSFPK